MKDVVFFNFFNNGDIHLSRGFVKHIIQKIHKIDKEIKFYYAHKCKKLLNDLNIIEDRSLLRNIPNHFIEYIDRPEALYINTWYATDNYRYMNTYGISFDTLFDLFNNICQKHFDFSLDENNAKEYFPIIDYNKFHIKNSTEFLNTASRPLILVANGAALSGQAANFNMTDAITPLAEKYHGIQFVLSEREYSHEKLRENIKYTDDIIKKSSGSDLNECSFISTYADMIIGRSSGVHTFSLVQRNLFERTIPIISFANLDYDEGCFWLSYKFKDKIKYSSDIKNYNIDASNIAAEKIDIEIRKMLNI